MVENHKQRNVEEHCKKLEERVQILQQEFQESLADQQTKWQEQFGEQNKRTDQISAQIEALSIQFQTFLANQITGKDLGSTSKGILQTPAKGSLEGMLLRGKGPAKGDQTYGQEQQRMVHNVVLPRMDLTTFWGDNPRGWLRRCKKFFKLNTTPFQRWVELASLYLEGKEEIWFKGYMCGVEGVVDWEEFSGAICSRFGNRTDIVEEFNKLMQEGDVDEYVERFEELKSLMHSLNSLLPESYYISSFISGLKEDIKPMLKILKPVTLMIAFDQAKWQEESNNVLARKNKFMPRPAAMVQMGTPIGNRQTNYVNDNQQKQKVPETMHE